jgi:hypothetical protein
LSTALISGDIVEIINTQPFNVADVYNTSQTYSRAEVDALLGTIDVDNLPDVFLMGG